MTAPMQPTDTKYCAPGPIDEMLFAHLHLAGVRTRIHVHEQPTCGPCIEDMAAIGKHGFALTTLIHELRDRLAVAIAAPGTNLPLNVVMQVKAGHVLAWDQPAALTSASRWTCTDRACGASVLFANGHIYGSAIERTCAEEKARWAETRRELAGGA